MKKGEITLSEHLRTIAAKGGHARISSMSKEAHLDMVQSGASIGGQARAKKLTKKQRSQIASDAAKARWAKEEG